MAAKPKAKHRQTLESALQNAARWHQAGELDKALPAYLDLIKQNYDLASTHNLLGLLYLQQRQPALAVEQFRTALSHGNSDPDIDYNLGNCLSDLGQHDAAISAYQACLGKKPDHVSAWYNLGLSHERLNQFDASIEALSQDYRLHARLNALVELSTVYLKKFDWDNSEKYAVAVLEKQPDHLTGLFNLATCRLGRQVGKEVPDLQIIEQCLRLGKSMIASHPESDKGYAICADALQNIGEADLALDYYRRALERAPNNAHAHANVGVIELTRGNLEAGWPEIIWRENYGEALYGMDTASYSQCPAPHWGGQVEAGKHLLIASEQGVGDQIMQAQLIQEILDQGMQVTMTCNRKLVSLLQRSFPRARLVDNNVPLSTDELGAIDYKVSQLEMCSRMRPSMASFRQPRAYLKADPTLVNHFKQKYSELGSGLRVGISWKSSSVTAGKQKSTDLRQWSGLLRTPGVQFISIQYGEVQPDILQLAAETGTQIYIDSEFNPLNDLEKAAAQISALDLVISVSNASVHLAGGLGIPTWVILHYMPLWHWFRNTAQSPWYPDLRLYRQQQMEGWQPVLDRIAVDLSQIVPRPQDH